MIRSITLLLLLALHLVTDIRAQVSSPGSIAEAIETARKAKTDLILLCIDREMVEASRARNFPSADKTLDSILNLSPTGEVLARDYLLYSYDPAAASDEDKEYVKGRYFFDYCPRMIVLDRKGQPVAYLQLLLLKPDDDLAMLIDSTRRVFGATAQRRTELEKKYKRGKIDAEDMLELIHLRTALGLRSRELWNDYPKLGRPLPSADDPFPAPSFLREDFALSDPFLTYLLEADLSYIDYKLTLVNTLADNRYEDNAVDDYTVLAPLRDSLLVLAFSIEDDQSPESAAFLQALVKDQLSRSLARAIELYARNDRTDLLVPAAESYTERIRMDYETQKAAAIQNVDDLLESMKDQLLDAASSNNPDSTMNWDEVKSRLLENEGEAYDRSYANELNQIAWAFYEHVSDTALLARALGWAQRSVSLDSQPYNHDTLAHLYAATGDKAMAVEHQAIAVDLATKDPAYKNQLAYLKAELEKFRAY